VQRSNECNEATSATSATRQRVQRGNECNEATRATFWELKGPIYFFRITFPVDADSSPASGARLGAMWCLKQCDISSVYMLAGADCEALPGDQQPNVRLG